MDRAQAHTLEAFLAAVIVITGVLFALGATAVTPLSASTSNQHIQNQEQMAANDLLASAAANGTLERTILYWNSTADGFYGAAENGYFANGGPPTSFGHALNATFRARRVAFNVYVSYWDGDAEKEQPLTYMGSPSDNAVAVGRTVTLYDDTRLTAPHETTNVSAAGAAGDFYARDASPGSQLFNVVEVRIVVWRM